MNITEIKKVLPFLIESNQTPNIIGEHGKGKSEIISQFAKENGYDYVINLRLGQIQDSGDLTGLPEFVEVEGVKVTKFMQPSFFPKANDKAILFLDEYNRCPPQLLQTIFQLIEKEGRLGEYQLPKDCAVILASNPPTDEYTVTDMQDKALMDRMVPIKFTPTKAEWFDYMTDKKADESVIAFLRDQDTAIEINGEDFSISDMVTPSRRSWDAVARLLKTDIKEKVSNATFVELLGGIVSPEVAAAYDRFITTYDFRVSGDDILNKYPEVKEKINHDRVDVLSTALEEIADQFKNNQASFSDVNRVKNLFYFLADIPKDLTVAFFQGRIEAKTKDAEGNDVPLLLDKELLEYVFNFHQDAELEKFITDNFYGLLKEEVKTDSEE